MESINDEDNIKLESMKISEDNKDEKSDLFIFEESKTHKIIKPILKIIFLFLIIFILMKSYGFKFPKNINVNNNEKEGNIQDQNKETKMIENQDEQTKNQDEQTKNQDEQTKNQDEQTKNQDEQTKNQDEQTKNQEEKDKTQEEKDKTQEKVNENAKNKTHYFCCYVAMGRNENRYVRFIVDYYTKLGVDEFIFADNNLPNTEKFEDVIKDYIDNGTVDIIEIFGVLMGQAEFYSIVYQKYNRTCDWFAFFDFDEYLYLLDDNKTETDLQTFLSNKKFDKCETVLFNWLIYDDNDLVYYDPRPDVERFTRPDFKSRGNIYVKSIVRGNINKKIFIKLKSNHVPEPYIKCCKSNGEIVRRYNPFNLQPWVHEYGYLKHFNTRTAEEFVTKIKTGFPNGGTFDPADRIGLFFIRNKFTQEKLEVFEKAFNKKFDASRYNKNKL